MLGHLKLYFAYFVPFQKKLWWSALYFLLKRLPMMSMPLVMMVFIDNYIPSGSVPKLLLLSLAVFATFLFNIIFHTSYAMEANADIVKNVSKNIRNQIVHRLQILSAGYLNRNHSGRLFSKIMVDVDKLEAFANQFMDLVFNTAITFIYSCAVLSVVNWKLFLIYVAFIPVYALLYRLFIGQLLKSQHELRLASERLTRNVGSFIQTQHLARVHGEEEYEIKRVEGSGRTEIDKIKLLRFNEALFGSLNSVTGELSILAVVSIGAVAVMKNILTVGGLILFLQMVTMVIENVRSIFNFFPQFTAFVEAMVSIREILDSPDLEHNEGKKEVGAIRGDITFQNVSFAHQGQAALFRDLTIRIPAGKTIALVGESGSGKTTFVNLLLGLYRPTEGAIRIDDYPIHSVDMRSIRRQMGVVTQDAIIFSGTVRDNITHARMVRTEEEIIQAAKDAHAYDFIMSLEKGFDTQVGEGGVQLSGGQKQRISIARAILRKPRILVLDEATSALDSESEVEVQRALDQLQGKQTTFIIAHRLSTIFGADRILVFKRGRIVEDGTHAELLAKKGEYAHLVELQLNMNAVS